METANASKLAELTRYQFRPAIVEAKLLTGKHAVDPIYVATLVEELSTIDGKMTAIEEALNLSADSSPEGCPHCADAAWIHAKSAELDRRLRRIEQNARAQAQTSQSASKLKKRALVKAP